MNLEDLKGRPTVAKWNTLIDSIGTMSQIRGGPGVMVSQGLGGTIINVRRPGLGRGEAGQHPFKITFAAGDSPKIYIAPGYVAFNPTVPEGKTTWPVMPTMGISGPQMDATGAHLSAAGLATGVHHEVLCIYRPDKYSGMQSAHVTVRNPSQPLDLSNGFRARVLGTISLTNVNGQLQAGTIVQKWFSDIEHFDGAEESSSGSLEQSSDDSADSSGSGGGGGDDPESDSGSEESSQGNPPPGGCSCPAISDFDVIFSSVYGTETPGEFVYSGVIFATVDAFCGDCANRLDIKFQVGPYPMPSKWLGSGNGKQQAAVEFSGLYLFGGVEYGCYATIGRFGAPGNCPIDQCPTVEKLITPPIGM